MMWSFGKIDIENKRTRQIVDINQYVASMRFLQGRILVLLNVGIARFGVTPGYHQGTGLSTIDVTSCMRVGLYSGGNMEGPRVLSQG
jgi:hypothetical protein